ncbi:hypothetical protein BP5796_05707 [Coleophoma crateriformis]|uniref:Acyltransferase 3 domain-containing protein n=1 Tax=Coleophoma crateriformis TaxID=565419 RepID=A0A3D8RV24_9HELO|nr:hypothetical protein BP5796_05707 [Coleophoma crateriformis]
MISTFMVVVLLRLGAYEWTRSFAENKTYMKNVLEWHPPRMDTTLGQLENWGGEMYNFIHVWSWEKFGGSTGYDVHLWTIPVEYRCSMMLFLIVLGTARLRTGIRFLCLGGIVLFVLRSDRWEMVLFLSGMILAELDVMRGAHIPPAMAPTTSVLPLGEISNLRPKKTNSLLSFLLAILALYLMSCPDWEFGQTPGWKTLALFVPEWFTDQYRFWQMIGSILFVACVARSPWWQSVFNTDIVQYFGRISYAIYLVHGPVLHTAGYAIERWAWGVTGTDGWAYNTGFIVAAFVNIGLVIWAADVFWRVVDAPTVRFAKWLESNWFISD